MSRTIQLTAGDGFSLPAYVARPAGAARGAVVVQEIFGVNSLIRAVADAYAADGFLAVAPDAFHRVQHGVQLGYTDENIQADIDHADHKVGVIGYCWGGLLTWRSACLLRGLAAAAPYYGGGMTVGVEPARQALCPVLCHFGAKDHAIPLESVEAFKLVQTTVEVQVDEAQHGFDCDQRGAFDAAAAGLARQRTLAFFMRRLVSTPSVTDYGGLLSGSHRNIEGS